MERNRKKKKEDAFNCRLFDYFDNIFVYISPFTSFANSVYVFLDNADLNNMRSLINNN